jgi:hypothetical protein
VFIHALPSVVAHNKHGPKNEEDVVGDGEVHEEEGGDGLVSLPQPHPEGPTTPTHATLRNNHPRINIESTTNSEESVIA